MIFHAHLYQSLLLATADECVELVDRDLLDLVGAECVAANQVHDAAGCADRYLAMEQKVSGIFEHLVVLTEQLLLLRQRRRRRLSWGTPHLDLLRRTNVLPD